MEAGNISKPLSPSSGVQSLRTKPKVKGFSSVKAFVHSTGRERHQLGQILLKLALEMSHSDLKHLIVVSVSKASAPIPLRNVFN